MPEFNNTVTTRVDDDTADTIATYADEQGMTRSEAVRHLVRTGLARADRAPGAHASYGALAALFGLIFASAQYADASGLLGPLGIVLVVGGIAHDLLHRYDLL